MKYFLSGMVLLAFSVAAAPLEAIHGEYVGTIQKVRGYSYEQGKQCSLIISVDKYFVTFSINGIEVEMDRKSVESAMSSGDNEAKLTRHLGERTFELAMLFMRNGRLRGVMVGKTDMGGYSNPANWRYIVCGRISRR